jgi:two-component system phosphate regulon sensor histidine kinase PhoR
LIRWKINLVIPIKSVNEELFGFLLLGNKKSGAKFTSEDVDLLKEIGLSAGSTIERLSLQEQLIREKMEAERLEELNRQKSMFVSTVSHELKTPLTSIKMFSELLRQREKNISETSKSHLEIIEGESDRLTRLINNVLNFSKIEKGVKEYSFREINFNIIVKKVLNTMQYSIKMKGFNLKTHLSEFDDLVFADEDAIIEAVENLISNAIRFSGDKNEIEINTFEENNFVCISIRDFGIGIESKDIDKIFDQFYRSQNVKIRNIDGTGLGLPIVKHIVEAHKGKIFVESKLGKGSKFTLCFPKSNKGDNNEENFNNRR